MKVLRDTNVQCDNMIEARRPDTILIDKKEQKGIIIDIVLPADVRVKKKKGESEKASALKERDLKIVRTKNGRSHACNDTRPWKSQKRI